MPHDSISPRVVTMSQLLIAFLLCFVCNASQVYAFMASMQSQGRSYFINAVQGDLILDCLFDMADFSLFANPIFWKKQQLEDEEQQMNFMGNILPPFFETNRFKITFVPQTTPHRHNPRLTISDVSLEDSGNYTCEIHGRRSVILAEVTYSVYVRASLQDLYFQLPPSVPDHMEDSIRDGSSEVRRIRQLTLNEGQARSIRCVAIGGYPPPEIRLHLGDSEITDRFIRSYSVSIGGKLGLRLMTYRTERSTDRFVLDAGSPNTLTCVASIPDSTSLFTVLNLQVQYGPIIRCETAHASIGDQDVHVACEVRSRPGVTALYWIVDANGTMTTLLSNNEMNSEYWTVATDRADGVMETRLYMGKVTLHSFRKYTVVAENAVAISTFDVDLLQAVSPASTARISPGVRAHQVASSSLTNRKYPKHAIAAASSATASAVSSSSNVHRASHQSIVVVVIISVSLSSLLSGCCSRLFQSRSTTNLKLSGAANS